MKNTYVNNSTIIDIINDPFGFTFDEINKIIGLNQSKALYSLLYKNTFHKFPRVIWEKNKLKDTYTQKYIFELLDKKCIETVCIKRKTGITACVSTQIGCKVQCKFCQSGKNGFFRNLYPSEIVQQIILLKENINRIVFMGIGEPLFNYDSLLKSIHILRDRNGLDFATDGITISTVGPIKELKKLREEHIKIQLILSLHATTQKTRDFIIPGMSGNEINQTVETALSYSKRHNRKIIIAYLLLAGINDKYSDIRKLVEWFKHENVMINLMKYNETDDNGIKKLKKEN